jgi:hypothetical protein
LTEADGVTAGEAGVVGCAGLTVWAGLVGWAGFAAGAEVEAAGAGVLVLVVWVRPTAASAIRAAAMTVPMTMTAIRYPEGRLLPWREARRPAAG